jgi:hypothetical protein
MAALAIVTLDGEHGRRPGIFAERERRARIFAATETG